MKRPEALKYPLTLDAVIEAEPASIGEVVQYLDETLNTWIPADIEATKPKVHNLRIAFYKACDESSAAMLEWEKTGRDGSLAINRANEAGRNTLDWGGYVRAVQQDISLLMTASWARYEAKLALQAKASEALQAAEQVVFNLRGAISKSLIDRLESKRALQSRSTQQDKW